MSISVRCFTYSGISMAHVASFAGQKADQSIPLFKEPYLARENLTVDTGTAVSSSAALSPQYTRILLVQVPPGSRCHVEINPPGRSTPVVADTSSRIIEGDEHFEFEKGSTISVLQVS